MIALRSIIIYCSLTPLLAVWGLAGWLLLERRCLLSVLFPLCLCAIVLSSGRVLLLISPLVFLIAHHFPPPPPPTLMFTNPATAAHVHFLLQCYAVLVLVVVVVLYFAPTRWHECWHELLTRPSSVSPYLFFSPCLFAYCLQVQHPSCCGTSLSLSLLPHSLDPVLVLLFLLLFLPMFLTLTVCLKERESRHCRWFWFVSLQPWSYLCSPASSSSAAAHVTPTTCCPFLQVNHLSDSPDD